MSKYDVIGLGAMNCDRLFVVDEVVADGEQVIKKNYQEAGGSAANTIYALAKLGIKCGFIGSIGDDNAGNFLIDSLHEFNVDTAYIKPKRKAVTGSTLCFTDKSGKRAIYINSGANDKLASTDVSISYVKSAKIIHLSSFVNNEQFNLQNELIGRLDERPLISFAPGIVYAAKGIIKLKSILKNTSFLFINQDEIEMLTGKDFIAGARQCLELGCKFVIVTLGKGIILNGKSVVCYVAQQYKEYKIDDNKTKKKIYDSTGAGDAFAAGFLFGFLKGKDIEKCGYIGHIMASQSIKKLGARKALPDYQTLSDTYFKTTGDVL